MIESVMRARPIDNDEGERMESDNNYNDVDFSVAEGEESESIAQLDTGIVVNEGPAFQAVRHNDIPRLSAILFTGYDINASNEDEDEPERSTYYEIRDWHRMVRNVRLKGYTPFHLAVAHSKLKTIKFLLSKGVDVNTTDANGMSPLALAAAVQRTDVAKILLDAGAIVDAQSVSGRTPLLQAISGNHHSTVQLLLGAGADANLADTKGTTPLLMCLQAQRNEVNNVKILKALISAGCLVDFPNKQGATAIMFAVSMGRRDAVDILLKAGADINKRDKSGQMVMHLASGSAMAHYLIQLGATSDWPDVKGTTPLDKAAKVGHLALMNLFLQSDSNRTNAVLDVPRVVQVREQIPLFDVWIHREFTTPRTLKRLCRQTIRGSLAPFHTSRIASSLPVPSIIKDFLLCKHLQLVFKSKHEQNSATIPTLHP